MNRKVNTLNQLIPGDVFHPGEFIKDELEARNMSQQDLVLLTGLSKSELSSIIHGRRNLSAKTAVILEIALGINAEFWMNLQAKYEIETIKKKFKKLVKTSSVIWKFRNARPHSIGKKPHK